MKIYTILFFLLFQLTLNSQIIIDEDYSDWDNVNTFFSDSSNDGKNGIDFHKLSVNNDKDYLYLSFDTDKEINLQSNNDIVLFIDIDNNINTGYKINGIGADISYFFGDRYGFYYRNSSKITIKHKDIGLISLPTVTSNKFELAINRKFKAGSYFVNITKNIKIIIAQDTQGGDKIPNKTGGFSYTMNDNSTVIPAYHIKKYNEEHLRVLTYNVEKDHFFDNEPPYKRLIKAANPDILCFQEVYKHSSSQVKDKIRNYFGGTWYHAKRSDDLIVVSKYPIIKSTVVGENSAFLIKKEDKEILIINAHLYCCDKDSKRQREVDEIMKFIRNAKAGIGSFTIKKDSPIIIVGDMNFVGSNRQRKTLIEGDIYNSSYGSDFSPDWDSSQFEDSKPVTTGYPGTFTWNSDNSYYPNGRLDYVIYSGSVLQKENSYALHTRKLERSVLDEFQLNISDSDNASDHFPVIVDFTIKNNSATNYVNKKDIGIVSYFPNPTSKKLSIVINSKIHSDIKISIFNNMGKLVNSYLSTINLGINNVEVDTRLLSNGIYYAKIVSLNKMKQEVFTIKFIKQN